MMLTLVFGRPEGPPREGADTRENDIIDSEELR